MSRDASYLQINGFDGVFRLEAVSLEGAPATAADAITARSGGVDGTDYAVQSADPRSSSSRRRSRRLT